MESLTLGNKQKLPHHINNQQGSTAYPSLHSVKLLRILLLPPPGWDASPAQVTTTHLIRLPDSLPVPFYTIGWREALWVWSVLPRNTVQWHCQILNLKSSSLSVRTSCAQHLQLYISSTGVQQTPFDRQTLGSVWLMWLPVSDYAQKMIWHFLNNQIITRIASWFTVWFPLAFGAISLKNKFRQSGPLYPYFECLAKVYNNPTSFPFKKVVI